MADWSNQDPHRMVVMQLHWKRRWKLAFGSAARPMIWKALTTFLPRCMADTFDRRHYCAFDADVPVIAPLLQVVQACRQSHTVKVILNTIQGELANRPASSIPEIYKGYKERHLIENFFAKLKQLQRHRHTLRKDQAEFPRAAIHLFSSPQSSGS